MSRIKELYVNEIAPALMKKFEKIQSRNRCKQQDGQNSRCSYQGQRSTFDGRQNHQAHT